MQEQKKMVNKTSKTNRIKILKELGLPEITQILDYPYRLPNLKVAYNLLNIDKVHNKFKYWEEHKIIYEDFIKFYSIQPPSNPKFKIEFVPVVLSFK